MYQSGATCLIVDYCFSLLKIQLSVLVSYKVDILTISLKCYDIAEKLLTCIKQQSITHPPFIKMLKYRRNFADDIIAP